MTNAVSQGAQLVAILMGANDVCASSVAAMTSVSTFRSQFAQAMSTLSGGLPDARIAVGSVPDIYNLWSILKDNDMARSTWSGFGICQSLLANPQSTDQADVDRRASVRQRNIDFNTQLSEVCALYPKCTFDNNAIFNAGFTAADVSDFDYFHPSLQGQTNLAAGAWALYDMDGDGWASGSEATIGTDPLDNCPDNTSDNAWPADINNDGHVDVVGDITLMAGQFGNSVPPAPVRYDIAPATPDHVIDVIGDISRLAGLFGQSCAP